jgi:hypothetical protein
MISHRTFKQNGRRACDILATASDGMDNELSFVYQFLHCLHWSFLVHSFTFHTRISVASECELPPEEPTRRRGAV